MTPTTATTYKPIRNDGPEQGDPCRPTCAARRNPNAECVCAELAEMKAVTRETDTPHTYTPGERGYKCLCGYSRKWGNHIGYWTR